MSIVLLKGKEYSITIGQRCPIAVNCNVGANRPGQLEYEKQKVDKLLSCPGTSPDSFMDLSILDFGANAISNYIIEKYGIPVGIVPIYNLYEKVERIEDYKLLSHIEKQARAGVSFMTMHFTADADILSIAKRTRQIPVTSRGGWVVLRNNYCEKRPNIYRRNIERIVELAKEYDFAISLGTTFRPSSIVDACDEAHILETERQVELSCYLRSCGVKVMMENVGHIGVDKIERHSHLLKKAGVPIMPLGPSVIDSAVGADHISSAIGAAFMGYYGVADIINAISPAEHQKPSFSIEDAIDAVVSAKVAAQTINQYRSSDALRIEEKVYQARSEQKSCIMDISSSCDRCGVMCPLKSITDEN